MSAKACGTFSIGYYRFAVGPTEKSSSVERHDFWSIVFKGGDLSWRSALRDGAILEGSTRELGAPNDVFSPTIEVVFLADEGRRVGLLGRAEASLMSYERESPGGFRFFLRGIQLLDRLTDISRTWIEESRTGLAVTLGKKPCTLRLLNETEATEARSTITRLLGRALEASAPVPGAAGLGVVLANWLEYPASAAVRQLFDVADAHSGSSRPLTSADLMGAVVQVGADDLNRSSTANNGAAAIFVRMLAERNNAFVRSRGTLLSFEAPASNPQRAIDPEADAIFRFALQLTHDTGHAKSRLAGRHLVMALLAYQLPSGERTKAHQLLVEHGFDVAELRFRFVSSLIATGPADEREAWRLFESAPTGSEARAWLPSFNADLSSGEDKLEMRPDIEAMASLILSRSLQPPLSIGLFGDWGSGKSFFMQKLRERIRELSRKDILESQSVYWPNVVTVEFNAWHYPKFRD